MSETISRHDFDKIGSLERPDPAISIARGDTFSKNLGGALDSEKAMQLIERFRQRNIAVDTALASYRVINHWDSLELLECERDGKKGWRKFSIIERLWLNIIGVLRNFGLSLEQIKKIKPFFFEPISKKCPITYAEYYTLGAVCFKKPVYFLVYPEGRGEFLAFNELIPILKKSFTNLSHHLSISLNDIFDRILTNSIGADFPIIRSVTEEQMAICDTMDFDDFNKLTIQKCDEGLKCSIDQTFHKSTSDHDLTKDYDDVDIEKKKRGGVIKIKKRTIHKKLTKSKSK